MIGLGIESTAHTFGIGILDDKKILSDVKDIYKPPHGSGIHPGEARDHHQKIKEEVLKRSLEEAEVKIEDIDIISYSAGPGLPPCLRVGMEFARELTKKTNAKLIAVNHGVAHIEIARLLTESKDPIMLFVSGGNTQIIGYAAGKYRIFGETQDIAIGNARDTFIRNTVGKYPGGPVMDELAKTGKKNYEETGKLLSLPYSVKGMDLSFSGIVTAALKLREKGEKVEDICFAFQETTFAMLTEVVERALAHTEKKEVLLTGGVAAAPRLGEMLNIMCEERGAKFYVVPKPLSGDNGAMIAWTGLLAYNHGQKPVEIDKADFYQKWRTDEVEITWIK